MVKPLMVDLFCGMGGWTDGFLAHGFRVIGVDVAQHPAYRGEFIRADVRDLDGRMFRDAIVICASPPCTAFTRHDLRCWYPYEPGPDMTCVDAAFRIGREAGVPFIVENVRGAKPFFEAAGYGRPVAHTGSFYLWGDGVPPLLPTYVQKSATKWSSRRSDRRARIPDLLSHAVARWHRVRWVASQPCTVRR